MSGRAAAHGRRRRLAGALAVALALVPACSGGGAGGAGGPAGGSGQEEAATTTAPSCRVDGLPAEGELLITGTDPVAVAAGVAERTHRCSEVAVVAPSDDRWAAAIAAAVAIDGDAPLLLVDPLDPARTRSALIRLDPSEVLAVGVEAGLLAPAGATVTTVAAGPAQSGPAPPEAGASGTTGTAAASDAAATPGDPASLALAGLEHLDADRIVAVPVDDAPALAAATAGLDGGTALVPLPTDPAGLQTMAQRLAGSATVSVTASDPARAQGAVDALGAAGLEAAATPGPLWPDGPAGTAWLVDPAQGAVAAVAATAAAGRDEVLLPVTASDLRRDRERAVRVRSAEPDRAVLVGDVTADAPWQLPLITSGPTLPGGGFALFDGVRMVALYGHPSHASLGVLGEQGLDAAVDLARQVAAPYGADGAQVLPAFEVIATVASAEAGVLGDYSRRTPVELLRPYVERAAREGFYVVLDLQPGRTDFLTQAKEYEELLLEPHVGLALDPEWRLLPDQVHLRQVGSVAAAEVQQVVDWLAELTRANRLPEKLLVLHQFRSSMLTGRDTITDPPELAMVVHMDGQGPIASKDGTYRAITAGAEDRWLWGWKNFFDEDVPTPSPQHVLGLDPVPVFVSYQ